MKKNAIFLLLLFSFAVFISGCGNKKSEETKKKEFYTCEEIQKMNDKINKVYKKETEYMTEEEIRKSYSELDKKYEKVIGLKKGETVKARGYFQWFLGGKTIVLDNDEDSDSGSSFMAYLEEIPPELVYISESEHPLLEVAGSIYFGEDNIYIKDAKVTSGTSKIDYDCNIDSLIDELISGLEEAKEDMLEYGESYENKVTLNDYFILNAEVKEVVNKNEFVLWDGLSDATMVAVKLDDLDISLKENDKVAIKSRTWDLENNDYIASCTILNYQDVGVFK